jgi:hypothetical protein
LVQCQRTNQALAVGGPADLGIVHQDQPTIDRLVNVTLHDVGAGADPGSKCREGVLRGKTRRSPVTDTTRHHQ